MCACVCVSVCVRVSVCRREILSVGVKENKREKGDRAMLKISQERFSKRGFVFVCV